MGLLADFQYPRRERPVSSDRTADVFDSAGSSVSKLVVYRPPGGIGAYQTFYTVPAGKVFLLRSLSVENNTVRLNGLQTWATSAANPQLTEDFDPPVKFYAGDTFSAWANVVNANVRLVGVEEDLSVQAARNFY